MTVQSDQPAYRGLPAPTNPRRCRARRSAATAAPAAAQGLRVVAVVAALLLAAILAVPGAAAFETKAREALLIDVSTGVVLFEKDADKPIPPASMSKVMTAFMVFQRLSEGKIRLEDKLPVSENAWRKGGAASGGSTMFLDLHSEATVEEMLRGVIIQSGNDASIALAEGMSGSEEAFAKEMNRVGKEIGLTNSSFRNSTGLPDPEHFMSSRDLAVLATELIRRFPQYYHYYSETEFVFNGIRQGNRNPLLYKNIGADGLKTGHTAEAGYCLTASAKQGDRRLALVITGLETMGARTAEAERLMSWGFREFENYTLLAAGAPLEQAEVWLGDAKTVPLTADKDIVITLPRGSRDGMKAVVRYDGPIAAPVARGQQLATLEVTVPGAAPFVRPLVAANDVEQLGVFGRLFAAVEYLVAGPSE